MFIVPTGKLLEWLAERHMPEAQDGLVLSDDQQRMLPALHAQAAGFKHCDEDERHAWAIWTAYTHAGQVQPPIGTPVVFAGAGTDDLGPTLEITRSSVSAIAKAAHAVDSAIRKLPDTMASVDIAAARIGEHHQLLSGHTDKLQACGRELALSLAELERISSTCNTTARTTAGTLELANVAALRTRELVRTMEGFTLHWPDGPVTVLPTPPPPVPLRWHQGPAAQWLRWGTIVALLVADVLAKHGR